MIINVKRMTITELLETVRASYIRQFLAFRESLLSENSGGVLSELALVDSSGHPVGEGAYSLPIRQDVCLVHDGSITQSFLFEPKSFVAFTPLAFTLPGGLCGYIAPFDWSYAAFSASPTTLKCFDSVTDWYRRWYDEADTGDRGEQGLGGVVHYLSDPTLEGDVLQFTVDLGTASIDAVDELIGLFVVHACQTFKIGGLTYA
jgi:hypothetical protein